MSMSRPPARPPSDRTGSGPGRQSRIRLALSLAIAAVAALALYIYQPSWFVIATPPPLPKERPTPAPTVKPKPLPDPGIGGSHTVDGITITLKDVQYDPGSGANLANKGYTYAIVTLRIKNLQGNDYSFVPNVNCQLPYCNFYISDSQGEKNPPVNYDPYHTGLRSVVLQPNGEQTGSYTFEVPARDKKLELLYYHQPLTDANNVQFWRLEKYPSNGR